jgi:cytoskeleton protein RodZ
LLIVLGRNSGGGGSNKSQGNTVATPPATTTAARTPPAARKPPPPRFARLQLQPSGQVWVCVVAAGDRVLEPGTVIGPADTLPTWRSSRFRMTFGNGSLTMRVNGKTLAVPAVSKPIGYVVDRRGHRRVLPAAQQPTCQ